MGRLGSELARKGVHISMGLFALALRWMTPWQAAACAVVALVFNLVLLHRLTGRALLRDGERRSGFSMGIALYPAVVLVLVLVFYRRLELAAAVWGLLAFGDGMATVAGVLLRGRRLPWNREKSWAGFGAFILYGTATTAFLVRWTQQAVLDSALAGDPVGAVHVGSSFLARSTADAVLSDPAFLIIGCLIASVAAAFAESLQTGVDDNLIVPLVGGAVLYCATLVEPARWIAALEGTGTNLLWGLVINLVLAGLAFAARGVGVSGAVWGAVLGSSLYAFGGWRAFLMLLLFFFLGTATTKVGYAKKAALGIAQEKGGRRGARNAFANTLVGVLCAFLALTTAHTALFCVALVAAFATAANDTVSSEIGQAYGRRHHLITNFRRVPAGTEGAVSLEGTLAGILGSTLLAIPAWLVGLISPAGAAIAVVAAFIGATLESYLGAAGGKLDMDNELMNFTNTAVGAAAAAGLFALWPTLAPWF